MPELAEPVISTLDDDQFLRLIRRAIKFLWIFFSRNIFILLAVDDKHWPLELVE